MEPKSLEVPAGFGAEQVTQESPLPGEPWNPQRAGKSGIAEKEMSEGAGQALSAGKHL